MSRSLFRFAVLVQICILSISQLSMAGNCVTDHPPSLDPDLNKSRIVYGLAAGVAAGALVAVGGVCSLVKGIYDVNEYDSELAQIPAGNNSTCYRYRYCTRQSICWSTWNECSKNVKSNNGDNWIGGGVTALMSGAATSISCLGGARDCLAFQRNTIRQLPLREQIYSEWSQILQGERNFVASLQVAEKWYQKLMVKGNPNGLNLLEVHMKLISGIEDKSFCRGGKIALENEVLNLLSKQEKFKNDDFLKFLGAPENENHELRKNRYLYLAVGAEELHKKLTGSISDFAARNSSELATNQEAFVRIQNDLRYLNLELEGLSTKLVAESTLESNDQNSEKTELTKKREDLVARIQAKASESEALKKKLEEISSYDLAFQREKDCARDGFYRLASIQSKPPLPAAELTAPTMPAEAAVAFSAPASISSWSIAGYFGAHVVDNLKTQIANGRTAVGMLLHSGYQRLVGTSESSENRSRVPSDGVSEADEIELGLTGDSDGSLESDEDVDFSSDLENPIETDPFDEFLTSGLPQREKQY